MQRLRRGIDWVPRELGHGVPKYCEEFIAGYDFGFFTRGKKERERWSSLALFALWEPVNCCAVESWHLDKSCRSFRFVRTSSRKSMVQKPVVTRLQPVERESTKENLSIDILRNH